MVSAHLRVTILVKIEIILAYLGMAALLQKTMAKTESQTLSASRQSHSNLKQTLLSKAMEATAQFQASTPKKMMRRMIQKRPRDFLIHSKMTMTTLGIS